MKIEAVSAQQLLAQGTQQAAGDPANDSRRGAEVVAEKKDPEKQVGSTELLDRIKSLTEDGAYSVRFEKNKDINDVVVKLVDAETGDVIRQIPPEELLGLTKRLNDLRAVIVNKQG